VTYLEQLLAQHKWIQDNWLSNSCVSLLQEEIGEANLKFVTGMFICQLMTLQTLHDRWSKAECFESNYHKARFEEFLQNIIDAE
jgi:hypothetical protein